MKKIADIWGLGKVERDIFLSENPGFLSEVAARTGKTLATVSRVFHRKIERSASVREAIEKEARERGLLEEKI